MKRCSVLLLLIFFAALMIGGCSAAQENPAVVISAPPPTVSLTPVASLTPAVSLAPTASPARTAQPTPTPTQTPAPTPDERIALDDDFYAVALDDALKKRITGMSYPEDDSNAAIRYADLRYVHILYVDFDGNAHEGELIVNKKVVKDILEIFRALYDAAYPLTSVRLVDDYGESADDNLSMAANNTSAFNYRVVAGSKTLSMHSYGLAVDVNPLFNPYVKNDGSFSPVNAADYVDRAQSFPGKIDRDDLCYKLFIEHGWSWGGDWKSVKDYQHFSKEVD